MVSSGWKNAFLGLALGAAALFGGCDNNSNNLEKIISEPQKNTNSFSPQKKETDFYSQEERQFNNAAYNMGFSLLWKDRNKNGVVEESEVIFPAGYLLGDASLAGPAINLANQMAEHFESRSFSDLIATPEKIKSLSKKVDYAKANYLKDKTSDTKEDLRQALRDRYLFGRPFAPQTVDYSILPIETQKVAWMMIYQAGPHVENVYMAQRDPNNLKYKKRIIQSGDFKDNLASFLWGEPWCPDSEEDLCTADRHFPTRIKNGGHWPPDFTAEMVEKVKNGSDKHLKSSFVDRVYKDGKLTWTSFNNNPLYRTNLEAISQIFFEASKTDVDPSLRRFLLTRGQELLDTSNPYPFWDGDIAWIEMVSSLELLLGPYEEYNSPFESTAMIEMFVGAVDKKYEFVGNQFSPLLKLVEKNISGKLGESYQIRDFTITTPIIYVEGIFMGDGIHSYIAVAYQLPNEPPYGHSELAKKVIILNHADARYDNILKPLAKMVFDPESLAMMDVEGFNLESLTHEMAHNLGTFPHYPIKSTGNLAKDMIGKFSSGLEEAKANSLAVIVLKEAQEKGYVSEKQVRSAVASIPVSNLRGFNYFKKNPDGTLEGDAHGLGSLIEFAALYKAGIITENADGTFHLNMDGNFYSAFEDLAYQIMNIQLTGDKKAAEELMINSYHDLPKTLKEKYLPLIREMPKEVNPIYKPKFSSEVEKWGYEEMRKLDRNVGGK